MTQKRKIAILYDFDQTLSLKSMQEYGVFDYLKTDADTFYSKLDVTSSKNQMDRVLAFMYELVARAKEIGKPLTRKVLNDGGKNIEFFPGVIEWFSQINKFGADHGFEVEHYLISSGLTEIVEGCPIAKEFKKIYACQYIYDEKGHVVWPARAINYTNKTQFIFRINKGILDVADDSINKVIQKDIRPIPYENIIYVGDGFTDIPCMKVVKGKGGMSIAVYGDSKDVGFSLYKDDRVTACCKADYTTGSEIDITIKNFILALQSKLDKNI